MTPNEIRIGIVSADPRLEEVVQEALDGARRPTRVGLRVHRSPSELEVEDVDRVTAAEPHLVILDMSEDPEGAIRVAGAIQSGTPRTALVGVGPELDGSVLLEAMRAGIVEYLERPAKVETVYEALGRVIHKRGWTETSGSESPDHEGMVLAFFSAKGGAGSTTVATNVGIELHRQTGKSTLLVDLDLEMGEIATLLGVQPRFHLVDLVRNFHRMDADLLASYIESHDSGVHVLSAPFQPEIGEAVTREQIAGILSFFRSHYDYVVVDTAKSLAPPALATLEAADSIFLVTNVDVPSIRNLKRCLPGLDQVTGGDLARLRLVVNRFNPKGLVGLKDLEETLGLEVYATLGNDYRTVIEAMSTGRPLVLNGSSKYASQIRDLARDITRVDGGDGEERTSILGRLLSPFRSGSKDASSNGASSKNGSDVARTEAPAHG